MHNIKKNIEIKKKQMLHKDVKTKRKDQENNTVVLKNKKKNLLTNKKSVKKMIAIF